jgi:hypothetical protein
MAMQFDPNTGQWIQGPGTTPQGGAPAQPGYPQPTTTGATGQDPNPRWVQMPDGRVVNANSPQFGGPGWGPSTAAPAGGQGNAPALPANNGGPGSQDTGTIQAWLTSQGVSGSDLNYYTQQIQSKSDGLSQANANYWAGKIGGGGGGSSSGGGGGMYGPQNTFSPLAPFGGIGGAPQSSYNPGGIGAPPGYQYQPIQGLNPFSFPGVYNPAPQPQGPQQTGGQAPAPAARAPQPPQDPTQGGPFPGAIMVNGGWRDGTNDQSPDVQAVKTQYAQAQSDYQTALKTYQTAQQAPATTGGQQPQPGQQVGSSPGQLPQPQPGQQVGTSPGQLPQPGQQIGVSPGQLPQPGQQLGTSPGQLPQPGDQQLGSSSPNEGVLPTGTDPNQQLGSSPGQQPQSGLDPTQQIGVSYGGGSNGMGYPGADYSSLTPAMREQIGLPPAGTDPTQQIGMSSGQQPQPGNPYGTQPNTGSLYAAGNTLPLYQSPQQFQSPGNFGYDALQSPVGFQGGTFQGPTADEAAADPGYQFALQQAQQGLQQSAIAKGGLNSTGTAKNLADYTQAAAGQQYQNVYARDLAAFQAQQGLNQSAYGLNAGTQLAYQGQGYGQSANTYGMNYANQFQANQANQANQLAAYQTNAGTQLGAQGQAFNQALQGYQTNAAQNFQNQQANFQNAYNVNQGNFGNQLAAYQATTGANQAASALNANTANQAWQNNYQQAWNTYQSQVQQQEAAAGLGYQYAGLGLQQQNQNYNQAANTYGMNYNAQYQQPFNNSLALAGLGYSAASNPYGQNYANNAGNIYQGIGNAYGAGQVGSANAFGQGAAGVANGINFAALYPTLYGQQPKTPQPFNPFGSTVGAPSGY